MPIYKKYDKPNSYWWIDITTPDGTRIRRSTKTSDRAQAQEYHDRLKAQFWRHFRLGEKADITFEEAAIQALKLAKSDSDRLAKARHIEYWRQFFARRTLSSLTTDEIIDKLPHDTMPRYGTSHVAKMKESTKNRYLSTMQRILTLAHKSGRLDRLISIPKFKEPKIRVRWITKEVAVDLISHINKRWLRDVASFALCTGARAQEILSLEWQQVDLAAKVAWITADKAKSGRARALPLNDDAIDIIKRNSNNSRWVFFNPKTGNRYSGINHKAFYAATKAINLEDFHFHDLRHTWASWHVQSGTPLFVLKELGGWETLEMVRKYAHLNAAHLIQHASNVTFLSLSA